MTTLLQDIRYAVRTLLRSPALACALILTLALGIGANATIFSIVDGILLRPLPQVQDAQKLLVLQYRDKTQTDRFLAFSYPEFQDAISGTQAVFENMAAARFGLDGIKVQGTTDRVLTNYVSGSFFDALGMRAAFGRLILPDEGVTPGANPVIVLSYDYWRSRFGGDPALLGKKIDVNGHPLTVVGVTPRGFEGVASMVDTQAYIPLAMVETLEPSDAANDFFTDRNLRILSIMARLRPGVSLAQAQAAANVLAARLAATYPKSNRNLDIAVSTEPDARLGPITRTFETIAGLFLALAGLVLLLACANVANLLLVRASAREREMAVRTALGAGRARLVRQMLTESVVLALLGGAVGLALGFWGSHALDSVQLGTSLPIHFGFGFDWRVFLYALAAALLTGVCAGLVPALRASGGALNPLLQSGTRVIGGRQWLRSAMVVAQVAGSLVLLVVAGLFVRSLSMARAVNLGFDPGHIADFSIDTDEIGLSHAQGRAFDRALLQRVRALPGVQSAALAFARPLGFINYGDTLDIPGYQTPPGQDPPTVSLDMVSPGYFSVLHIPLLEGRDFTDADTETSQYVAIVNRAMAVKYWPGEDPIGRSFTMDSLKDHPLRIVGIAQNSVTNNLFNHGDEPFFYVPTVQDYYPFATLMVRTDGPPEGIFLPVEATIPALASGLAPFDVETQQQGMGGITGYLIFEIGAVLAGSLGILGLVLAVIGVYGVISYSTVQRTHEIGIRMALGAQPATVLLLIFRQGLMIVCLGIAVGLALAFAAGRVAGQFLLGVSGHDPQTFFGVTLVLAAVALLASYLPARRATQLDPWHVLRLE